MPVVRILFKNANSCAAHTENIEVVVATKILDVSLSENVLRMTYSQYFLNVDQFWLRNHLVIFVFYTWNFNSQKDHFCHLVTCFSGLDDVKMC